MTTPFDLRTMALLLRQGARLDALSWGALLVAAGWLVASIVVSSLPGIPVAIALVASLAVGLAQSYCALRIGFDAALFDALADAMSPDVDELVDAHSSAELAPESESAAAASRQAAAMLDHSLQSLGLQPPSKAGRDWSARWAGASRLLRLQALCLAAQLIMLLIALTLSLAPALSRTMPA